MFCVFPLCCCSVVSTSAIDCLERLISEMTCYGDCLEVKSEYYQNCSGWIVWHNVHSQQYTYVSSSYRSNRLGLSHWDPYAVHRGGCLELCYCNMVEWFWWHSSLISTTNWFPSVLWHCWLGHLACKDRPRNNLLCIEWDVKPLHYYYYCCLIRHTCILLLTCFVWYWLEQIATFGAQALRDGVDVPAAPPGYNGPSPDSKLWQLFSLVTSVVLVQYNTIRIR